MIPKERLAWIEEGILLRRWRTEQDRSLREEAKRRALSAVELSDMENGRIKPVWPDGGRLKGVA